MAFAVATLQSIGRDIAHHPQSVARARAESDREASGDHQKFGALVPTYTPRRDDRVNSLDYSSAPFIAQLIASRDTPPTHLQHRMQSDRTANAYQAAEALPDQLPIGLYLEHSI